MVPAHVLRPTDEEMLESTKIVQKFGSEPCYGDLAENKIAMALATIGFKTARTFRGSVADVDYKWDVYIRTQKGVFGIQVKSSRNRSMEFVTTKNYRNTIVIWFNPKFKITDKELGEFLAKALATFGICPAS